MENVPKEVCYTFDAVGGHVLDTSGAQWFARNPDYDPGPPPPPRPPKAPHAAHVTLIDSPNMSQAFPTGSSDAAAESVSSVWPVENKPFFRYPSHSIRGARGLNVNTAMPYSTQVPGRTSNESQFPRRHPMPRTAQAQETSGTKNDGTISTGSQNAPSASSRGKRRRYRQTNQSNIDREDQQAS